MSLRIAWLTPYGEDKLWDPALRLRRWNVHNELLRLGIDLLRFYLGNCIRDGVLLPADGQELLHYLLIAPLVLPRLEDERDEFFTGHQTTGKKPIGGL